MGAALGIGGQRIRPGVAFLPIECIEVDPGAGDRLARFAREDKDVLAAFIGAALEQDDVPDDDVERLDTVLLLAEILAGGSGHEVESGRQPGREVDVGLVFPVIGGRGERGRPGGGRPALLYDLLGLTPIGEQVVVLGCPDPLHQVDRVGPEEEARPGSGASPGRTFAPGHRSSWPRRKNRAIRCS